MKYVLLVCLSLSGCGVGSDPATPVMPPVKSMAVKLNFDAVPPSPFVFGPSGTQPTPASAPTVTFVSGPVDGPIAVVNPTIIAVNPTTPFVNWCTDGFVIGPCVPLPPVTVRLDANVVLPTPFFRGPVAQEFVAGPVATVTFVATPVIGRSAIVKPEIFVSGSTSSQINWCTAGTVVGPCTAIPNTCSSVGFVSGPCP